jgi:malonyl-CoA/methylmalonyl-CoA synthetase
MGTDCRRAEHARVSLDLIQLIARAGAHGEHVALLAADGVWSYDDLLERSASVAGALLNGSPDLDGARVAFLVGPSCAHVAVQWGIWRAGGVAVPLCVTHPAPELAYTLDDSAAALVVADAALMPRLQPLAAARGLACHAASTLVQAAHTVLPAVDPARPAMILYTSGTTSKPKGVVSTHAMLAAQIQSVVEAWEISAADRILHVLPLHHLHGILNLLCAPLWAGATCELQAGFDAATVWNRFAAPDGPTVFMAVPTIYARLLTAWQAAAPEQQRIWSNGSRRLRLMVCGSAALPVTLLDGWRAVTGHTLLERYGMTEIGMGLGNPLHGERLAGHVGQPFPGVAVRLVDEAGHAVADDTPGGLQVSGPTVFREYWQRPDETRAAFTADGWFKTGDIAVRTGAGYRILGRDSIDIIKTGGYKVSALEIEEALREHPAIHECAVVGVDDAEWGQRVAAAVLLAPGATLDLEALRAWAKQRLAPYKVPTLLRVVDDLPRNPMGKVMKPALAALFGGGAG